jgi:hypothetical protein
MSEVHTASKLSNQEHSAPIDVDDDVKLCNQFLKAMGYTKPPIEQLMSAFGIIFSAQYFLVCQDEPNEFASVAALLQRANQLGWRGDPRDWRRFFKLQPDPTPEEIARAVGAGIALALAKEQAERDDQRVDEIAVQMEEQH